LLIFWLRGLKVNKLFVHSNFQLAARSMFYLQAKAGETGKSKQASACDDIFLKSFPQHWQV
jgi:hypothetical protein